MLASVLPEKAGIEISDATLELEPVMAHRLFIKGLPWRASESVTSETVQHVYAALGTPGIWLSVYEAFLKLSLVPNHRLNAEAWLHQFLLRQSITERDTYLSLAFFKSYDDGGAVKALIDAALRADLSRWPKDSRWLAALTLAWLSSCADRRVRDQATKGLARVIGHEPSVAERLVATFPRCDDDYVLESIALATYSACLLTGTPTVAYVPALNALSTPGYASSNILVRDTVQLLGRHIYPAGPPASLKRLEGYPARVEAPNPWPTLADAQPLLSVEHLPSNMELWGQVVGPDFWRYCVEPLVNEFDLAGAGVTLENVASWMMVETLRLGYPGRDNCALKYDLSLAHETGSGRGRPGYAERLGKKYYWIALHRLMGILADNVTPAKDFSGRTPKAGYLWSVGVRKCDLTDVRDISAKCVYPEELFAGPKYPFPREELDVKAWTRLDDLTPHRECIIRRDSDGVEWVALALSARDSDRTEGSDDWSKPYRNIELFYASALMPTGFRWPGKDRRFENALGSNGASCYRSYFAEYPNGEIFRQCLESGDTSVGPSGMCLTELSLARGGEWEYDYSAIPRQESLNVPCPDLVNGLGLRWDRQSGWTTNDGALAAFAGRASKRSALFVRRSLLDDYLTTEHKCLVFRRFASRGLIATGGGNGCQLDVDTYFVYEPNTELRILAENKRPFNC